MEIHKNNYCLVGFGNHAKNKILPTLEKGNQNIFGIVSSKQHLKYKYTIFKNLGDALKKSNSNTNFIIASPPEEHYKQIKEVLKAERNIFVEKPIFTELEQVKKIVNLLKGKSIFVTELLMYKHTKIYEKFLQTWKKKKNKCIKIECFFNIPNLPQDTFRDGNDITSSPLYDIGCYAFSLLVDLKISLENLKMIETQFKREKIVHFSLGGFSNDLEIYIEFGIKKEYKNIVKLKFQKGYHIIFDKFFYGVESNKQIIITKGNNTKNLIFTDQNGFENIFQHSKSFWMYNQKNRFNNILKVNNKLSALKSELSIFN